MIYKKRSYFFKIRVSIRKRTIGYFTVYKKWPDLYIAIQLQFTSSPSLPMHTILCTTSCAHTLTQFNFSFYCWIIISTKHFDRRIDKRLFQNEIVYSTAPLGQLRQIFSVAGNEKMSKGGNPQRCRSHWRFYVHSVAQAQGNQTLFQKLHSHTVYDLFFILLCAIFQI